METAIRILIFGASLQNEAPRLKMEYASKGVDLAFHKKEAVIPTYLLKHDVYAYIVDVSGEQVARYLREYENVEVGYTLTDPALLEATILKIIASRPRRPARRAA